MPLTTAARNTALDALTLAFVSLHSADPGATGASEISGGTPAYARKASNLGTASGGRRANTAPVSLDVPGGNTQVSYYGFWSAATGGTFLGGRPTLDPSTGNPVTLTFSTQGTATFGTGQLYEDLT